MGGYGDPQGGKEKEIIDGNPPGTKIGRREGKKEGISGPPTPAKGNERPTRQERGTKEGYLSSLLKTRARDYSGTCQGSRGDNRPPKK